MVDITGYFIVGAGGSIIAIVLIISYLLLKRSRKSSPKPQRYFIDFTKTKDGEVTDFGKHKIGDDYFTIKSIRHKDNKGRGEMFLLVDKKGIQTSYVYVHTYSVNYPSLGIVYDKANIGQMYTDDYFDERGLAKYLTEFAIKQLPENIKTVSASVRKSSPYKEQSLKVLHYLGFMDLEEGPTLYSLERDLKKKKKID